MTQDISLRFESKLHATREEVWEWITSIDGILAEMRPYLRMTAPKGVRSLNDLDITPGVPMFRSRVFLLGVIPFGHSDMTLIEIDPGHGFVEQSPMGSMEKWRHERWIKPTPGDADSVLLVDELTFRPRFARPVVGWFIRRLFEHRHKVLRAALDKPA
ncbi:MAG: hypothetical protein MEQ84_00130 [Mesorhizobium sp.]|nr:hypothetical protein [Mesorhizobium sp.]